MARKVARRTTGRKRTARKTTARKTTTRKTAKRKTTTRKKTTKKKATSRKKASTKRTTTKAKKAEPVIVKSRKSAVPKNRGTLSYTQTEFFDNVMGFCGLSKRSEAKELCEDLANFLKDALKRGYKVPLMGLGKMYVRKSKARMGRNPATGEPIHIPAKKRIRFTAAKALKEAVL